MCYLLREVLLGALGIQSDLKWGTSNEEISAIDLELVPPSAGALINHISSLGDIYKSLEQKTQEQQSNPFCQALYDSIENYLDQYRSTILRADMDITKGILTTLTGLVAYLEPYQHELQFINRILDPLIVANPVEMINKLHEAVVISPPSISQKLASLEWAVHQVAIAQLNSFLFYHQQLPDLFEKADNGIISYKKPTVTFLPRQLSDLLLLIVNVADHCDKLFDEIEPPEYEKLNSWTTAMAYQTSQLLSKNLRSQWPDFSRALTSFFLVGRSDYIALLAQQLMKEYITPFILNNTFSKLEEYSKIPITFELNASGAGMKYKMQAPLDLICTIEHQTILSEMFSQFMKLASAEESLNELWRCLKKYKKAFMFVGFAHEILSVIQEHIVFIVIIPALSKIQQAGENITDFLKFQQQFAQFIVSLTRNFPFSQKDLKESIEKFTSCIIQVRKLLVKADYYLTLDENMIMDAIKNECKDILQGAWDIKNIFNDIESNSVDLAPRIEQLINCIKLTCQIEWKPESSKTKK